MKNQEVLCKNLTMEMLKEIDKALEEIYEFSMRNAVLKIQKMLSHFKVFFNLSSIYSEDENEILYLQ